MNPDQVSPLYIYLRVKQVYASVQESKNASPIGCVEYNSAFKLQLLQVKTETCQDFGPVQAAGEPRG